MNCITLKPVFSKEKLPLGASKFWGTPDVCKGFRWPKTGEFLLDFICQINCAEIAPFDTENLLPHTGMLYFFYDLFEMPLDSNEDKKGARVVYVDCQTGLESTTFCDQEGADLSHQEMQIVFGNSENYTTQFPLHQMLGISQQTDDGYYDLNGAENWQLLLQVDSFETKDFHLNFVDGEVLCYLIDLKDLKKHNFSKVKFLQLFS